MCEQRFKGAPSDADADIVPAASVVCRLLLKNHLRVLLLSPTCNCVGCIFLCIPAVSSIRAGGRGGAAIAATAARFWGYRATCKQVFIPGTAMLQHIPQLSKMEA